MFKFITNRDLLCTFIGSFQIPEVEQKVLLAVKDEDLPHVHRRHSCRDGRAVPVEYFQEHVLLENAEVATVRTEVIDIMTSLDDQYLTELILPSCRM